MNTIIKSRSLCWSLALDAAPCSGNYSVAAVLMRVLNCLVTPSSACRDLFVGTVTIALLVAGCASQTRLPPTGVTSIATNVLSEEHKAPANPDDKTEQFARHYPGQAELIRSGKDFTVVPPGTYKPLPSTELLGAASLKERDEICEVLIQRFAARVDSKYGFIGFTSDGINEYDPSQEMLQRIRELKLGIEPVSALKESRMEDGERVETEQAENAMNYIIFRISRPTEQEDEVEVDVNECPRFYRGGTRVTYALVRTNGRWTITKEKIGSMW